MAQALVTANMEQAERIPIFQQRVISKNEVEFRSKIGRNKAIVFRRHDETGYYYIDLYDNRKPKPGHSSRSSHICLGMDELDALITLRTNLDSLKACFP